MSTSVMTYNELLTAFKKAESKDEQVALLIDTFQQMKKELRAEVQDDLEHVKHDTLKEIKLEDLATKKDITTSELAVKLEIYKEISRAKWQVFGFFLTTAVVMVFLHILLHHWGIS